MMDNTELREMVEATMYEVEEEEVNTMPTLTSWHKAVESIDASPEAKEEAHSIISAFSGGHNNAACLNDLGVEAYRRGVSAEVWEVLRRAAEHT